MRRVLLSIFPSLDIVKSCLNLLHRRDRFLLLGMCLLQMSLVFLDLIGILLIGSVVAIATSAVQSKAFPSQLQQVINAFGLQFWTPQDLATLFAIIATFALLGKSFLTYYLNLRNLRFLATREANLATNMARMIFSQPITTLQKFGTPEYVHSLGIGANSALTGILGGIVMLAAEVFLQLVMASTLFVFSPTLLILFFLYFGCLFALLHYVLGTKAHDWSREMTNTSILSTTAVIDSLGSYREIVVSGRREFFLNIFSQAKLKYGSFSVRNSMLGQFSKYVFENSVIIGAVIFAAYAFLTRSALEAASLLALFVAAASRIAPSVLKIQTGILAIRGSIGATTIFFQIYNHINSYKPKALDITKDELDCESGIQLNQVTFSYPEADRKAVEEMSCIFEHGKFTAIVGPSGSGKSTLVDLILGVLEPDFGEVVFFGVPPRFLLSRGVVIGYVPQNIYLKEGSILENVCFGIQEDEIELNKAWEVLDQVLLGDWIRTLPDEIRTYVGERGSKLSGGQRQRIGIARALYSSPSVLVLDEATSALDSISEFEISETIRNLDKSLTKIVIAHRLSTVLRADKLIYLNKGRIIAEGSFQDLRRTVPDFDRQAELMGIDI